MRVAVDTATQVGNRSVRALLGEAEVEYVGVLGGGVPKRERSGPVGDLESFDVLVSDGKTDFHSLVGQASVAGIPLVLWQDLGEELNGSAHQPVIHGANVATSLTAALANHPVASIESEDRVRTGWTEPGKPRRTGESLSFPEPVGNSWCVSRGKDRYAAFRDDEWGGAVVDVEGPNGRRIVGVADHAAYIEAITLAAVALVAAEGAFEHRFQSAATKPEHLLNKLNDLELEVAVWRSTE